MFAIAAMICFILAMFNVSLGGLSLVDLGLALVAAHLAFGTIIPLTFVRAER